MDEARIHEEAKTKKRACARLFRVAAVGGLAARIARTGATVLYPITHLSVTRVRAAGFPIFSAARPVTGVLGAHRSTVASLIPPRARLRSTKRALRLVAGQGLPTGYPGRRTARLDSNKSNSVKVRFLSGVGGCARRAPDTWKGVRGRPCRRRRRRRLRRSGVALNNKLQASCGAIAQRSRCTICPSGWGRAGVVSLCINRFLTSLNPWTGSRPAGDRSSAPQEPVCASTARRACKSVHAHTRTAQRTAC
ncbi:hypothetical protein OF83DRAFT_887416 [Amylostereum chailletii]|nr:hypothetical protein OF83DRAFT_887416 [Amylostereum chailletii]